MDAKAMKTMLKMEGDMFAIAIEDPSDLLPLSCLLWGNLIIGLGLGFLKVGRRNFVIQVPMYFSTFSIK